MDTKDVGTDPPMTMPTFGGQDLSLEALTEELSVLAHWCFCPFLVVGILASVT